MGAIVKFFEWLWLRGIKNWWSYLRWHKYVKEESMDVPLIETDSQIISACRDLYRGFEWEMDGLADAFDTYVPAQYAYNRMTEYINDISEDKYRDDCDGFHAGVYHMLQENGYDVALITLATIPITESHTMTAIRYEEDDGSVYYKVVNYTALKGPYKTIQEFVDNYGTPVRYWCLQKYDLEKGKYYNIDKEDF